MRYTARKILTLLVTMLVVSLLTFAAFDMISGDPAATLLGTQATPEKVEALRTEMGLNRPMLVRYGEWLAGFFTGNLGVSFQYRQPVQALLGPKMLVTLCLSLVSFVLIVVVSLPLGLLSANGKLDGLHTFLNQFCMAVPPFFTGILISWCFGICLRAFVPGDFPGLDRNLGRSLVYLFFAAVSIAIPRVAMTVRMLRSTVISEMNKPYVRTAIARGNDRRQVLWGHVLKNSLVPTVTFLGQTMAEIVAGSIVVEQVFSVPGLGRMLVASISSQDYPVVEAIVVILAFWVVLSGTAADEQLRCNQIWALSMPYTMLTREQECRVLHTVEQQLFTSCGLRTLAPSDPEYVGFYGGDQVRRDMAYHQGTTWVFPLGAFFLSYLKVRDNSPEAKADVRAQLAALEPMLREGCAGQLPEIYDGDNPGIGKGCFAQAWSVGEILRVYEAIDKNGGLLFHE